MNRSLALLAAQLCALPPAFAQVVRIGGGASTISDTYGAEVTLYQPDAITQTSLGYAQGLHLGASREVESGALSATVGDSMLRVALPTDLPGGARVLRVRGVLLQTLNQRTSATDNLLPLSGSMRTGGAGFAGWTGDGYQSAYFSSVQPSHAIAFATGFFALTDSIRFSAIAMRGTQSSLLASGAWQLRPTTQAALTMGWSGGRPVVQVGGHGSGQSWRVEGNYTSTALHLQPEPSLASLSLERIGWNVMGSKHVSNWLWVDAARHEFATADAVDSAAADVTAGRSVLYEAGATVRWHVAEAGGRALQSISGTQHNGGYVLLGGWVARRWDVRGTAVRNRTPDGTVSYSASIDTSERVTSHLKMTQGTNFANGAPSFDFGGTYENRFGALAISHHESYVPFGSEAGFHRVLAIGIRLHVRDTEVTADQISSHGLNTFYDASVDSFHGDSLGAGGMPSQHSAPSLRYAVSGRVTTPDGEPVRGAAVEAGPQTVFTDSEGRFLARFARADTVRVAVAPAAFLSSESYRDRSGSQLVQPRREESADEVALTVDRCTGCAVDEPSTASATEPEGVPEKPLGTLGRAGRRVKLLGQRMARLVPSRTGA